MSEPRRLIDSGGIAAELLRSAGADQPPPESLDRALAATAAALGTVRVPTPQSAALPTKVGVTELAKYLVLGVVGGLVVGLLVIPTAQTAPSNSASEPAARAKSEPVGASSADLAPGLASRPSESRLLEPNSGAPLPTRTGRGPVALAPASALPDFGTPVPAASGSPAPSELESPAPPVAGFESVPAPRPSLAEEQRVLERARAALTGGDPNGALLRLDQYARRFPRPRFGQEAALIRLESLVAAGRCVQARRHADRFASGYPESALRRRVDSVLKSCFR